MKKLFTLGIGLALSVFGCTEDRLSPPSCCTEFKVGADLSQVDFGVEPDIRGQYVAFAQASGDLTATAQGMVEDVAGACKAIVQAGGANATKGDDEPTDRPARVQFWCDLAVARINAAFSAWGSAGVKGSLTVNVVPAKCSASFKAEAKCQASCDASGRCDLKASPPTCEGGKLEVSCSGSCEGEAGASIACEGSCSGTCKGTCSSEGGVGVECDGKCDGVCSGAESPRNGVQADGSCRGVCNGTCTPSATATPIKCVGVCKGECAAKCEAKAGATVKCDGKCSANAEPLSCKGGTLKSTCNVDASCQSNCKGSAEAKAECTPPQVDLQLAANAQGSATAEMGLVVDALRANLPTILLVAQARGEAFAKLVSDVSTSGAATLKGSASGKLGFKGTICLIPMVSGIVEASRNAEASVKASASVAATVQ